VTTRDLIRRRLYSQRLIGTPFDSPIDTVRWLGAVQAQDYHGAKWGLGLRTSNTNSDAIDRSFNSGAILRTHILRPTWHFVLPGDIRWMLALTSPRIHALTSHYCRRLELDAALLGRASRIFADALSGNTYLTRSELAAALARNGIKAAGQPLAQIVMHAELDGVICSGQLREKGFTYALLDERVPPAKPRSREEALAELTRRFVTSHGPATPRDFAWWSGLTMADARTGFETLGPEFTRATVEGKTWWMTDDTAPRRRSSTIHMLPNFDEHTVAYKDREGSLDAAVQRRLAPTSAVLMANILTRDGRFVGGWRRALTKKRATVHLSLRVKLDARERRALEESVAAYGAFVGMTADVGR
jgi:hypothetical protein